MSTQFSTAGVGVAPRPGKLAAPNPPLVPVNVTITAVAGATNTTLITFQVVDKDGVAVPLLLPLHVFLSDLALGAGPTVTTASGAVGVGASGKLLGTLTSKMSLLLQTDATGKAILSIVDSAKTLFYPCCYLPGDIKKLIVGTVLATGSYG